MIRSKLPVEYNPMRRKSGVLYLQACNKKEDQESGTVEFTIRIFTLETVVQLLPVQREVTNEDGSKFVESFMANVQKTFLKELPSEKAIFRFSTFYNIEELRSLTPDQYDQALIQQIDRVNKLTPTGNEIQKDFFFFDWTASDLEIVTGQQLIELLTPVIVE